MKPFREIELLILDVDGVLTDGSISYSSESEEIKTFHARDGLGIRLWKQAGKKVAIITGRNSSMVERRAKELGIDWLIQGATDKVPALQKVLSDARLSVDQIAVVGDDLPDLPLVRLARIGIAVGDASNDLKQEADWITQLPGGRGAVREAIEFLLKKMQHWEQLVKQY